MENKTIAFIGGGNMARSLIGGLIADGFPADRIRVAEPDPEQRGNLSATFGVRVTGDNRDAVADADGVVLAVKPQVIRDVATELAPQLARTGAVVISIAAGIRESDLSRWLGDGLPVVRVMPNTPSLVQTGATALYANTATSTEQRSLAESLMRAVGLTCWLDDENQMNAVTAVSGSGPAYFFLLMESMEQAGADLGLPRETARLLTLQTALGAAKMALESAEDVATLRRQVTSPGGTTEQAIQAFEDGGLRELVEQALKAAADRAESLGDELGNQ
ncbi:pyrroline-5-carboxylate reductase [Aquisalimonas asiatica]|uniref:Pyrroline-5-carboxylate reductase n=1 Tax=Aquisalimonas asiatica TaxID=406100 RepID=A0A1H8TPB0_9GAMM|nr:pyrroline-5-carboxylate reductase [Aquisalimonas asiatica]SEO92701.1 pyrroline-5-carboxylate reductase [Aquisalimonas asiatica]